MQDNAEASQRQLFTAWCHRPAWLVATDFTGLSPLFRALLTMDGTVTSLLWGLSGEDIRAEPLAERLSRALSAVADGTLADIPVTHSERHIALRGEKSTKIYCVASSLLATDRLPPDFFPTLRRTPAGIGAALNVLGVETRRVILWYGLQPAAAMPSDVEGVFSAGAYVRCYQIFSGGRPVVAIVERFPTDLQV